MELQVEPNITMRGDANLLIMFMQNLVENAWKFTGNAHHPKIEVGIREYAGQQCCCVSDNGVGFDMEYAGKLFGAFQRLHSVNDYPGTGIGLATVQRIISRHGGKVFAEAQEGKGARFYFCLTD